MGLHLWILVSVFFLNVLPSLSVNRQTQEDTFTYDYIKGYFTTDFLLYADLDYFLSCQGFCNIPSDFDSHRLCSCDKNCLLYGDCCLDYIQACHVENVTFQNLLDGPKSKCVNTSDGNSSLIISQCPYSETACLYSNSSLNTIVPVMDLKTGLFYSQAYCAYCNNVKQIIPWDVSIVEKTSDFDGISMYNQTHNFMFSPPRNLPNRMCLSNFTRTCLVNGQYDDTRYACEHGPPGYVAYDGKEHYNIFCALCSSESHEKESKWNEVKIVTDPNVISKFSLRLHFSINFNTGLSFAQTCPEDQIFIASEQKCRKVLKYVPLDTSSYLQINAKIYYETGKVEKILPMEIASKQLSILEVLLGIIFEFSLGPCKRQWQEGSDEIQIIAINKGNISETELVQMLQNVSTSFQHNFQKGYKYKTMTIQSYVSNYQQKSHCTYVPYNKDNVTADQKGNLLLPGNRTVDAGDYFMNNNSIYICFRKVKFTDFTNLIDNLLGWVTLVSMTVSVLCLILHLVLTCKYKPKRLWRTTGLALCLLLTNVCFLLAKAVSHIALVCYVVGVLLHWSFLSTFSWMTFVAADIWMGLTHTKKTRIARADSRRKTWKFSIPFIPPTIVVLFVIFTDRFLPGGMWKPGYGNNICWINGIWARLVLFVLPGGLCVLTGTVFTILSGCRLYRLSKLNKSTAAKQRNYLVMFVKLAVVTGLGWCVGFLAVPTNDVTLYVIFILLTATQGLWILVVTWGGKCKKILRLKKTDSISSTKNNMDSRTPVTVV